MGWWHLINTRVPKITFSECSSVRKGGGGGKNIDKIGSRAIFSTRLVSSSSATSHLWYSHTKFIKPRLLLLINASKSKLLPTINMIGLTTSKHLRWRTHSRLPKFAATTGLQFN